MAGARGRQPEPVLRDGGGLTTSTILTLVILPFIYTLVDDVAVWLRRVWRQGMAAPARPPAPAGAEA